MNINPVAFVAILGTICSILFAFLGYNRGTKKDCKSEGQNSGTLMSDIGYIKSGVDDLKRKQEAGDTRHYNLVERVTKVEASSTQAHKRIDEMKKEGAA